MVYNLKELAASMWEHRENKDFGRKGLETSYRGLSVKASIGMTGNIAKIPWISYCAEGQETQKGIYPVLIFYGTPEFIERNKNHKVIKKIVLAYGVSATKTPDILWGAEVENKKTIGDSFVEWQYKTSDYGIKKYNSSYVYKIYDWTDDINYDEIQKDIDSLITINLDILENAGTKAPKDVVQKKKSFDVKIYSSAEVCLTMFSYRPYITAIKSKPFLLLAGISGTGKSRIVREFAFKSCPKYLQDKEGTTPGNYCMIEVKPNWHDSTELLGYYSNLSGSYQFKKFVKFLVKAMMFPDVPFFVCLDEMNLAPVEQYFAEILSILETRKHPKGSNGEIDMSTIQTEVIIDARYFQELSRIKSAINQETGAAYDNKLTDKQIYMKLFGIDSEENIDDEIGNRKDLTTRGLTLPDNVIIIGTVNMDDTTHQFSRKVIDRAMTIEMNGGKLIDMFGGSKDLEYIEDEEEQKNWQYSFKQKYVNADEVLIAHSEQAEDIKRILPQRLESINMALKGTPFEVSYRVLNELTIMVGVMLDDKKEGDSLDNIINQAVNNILLMKILPRIEGDAEMFALSKAYKDKLGITYNDRLEWLKALAPDIVQAEDTQDESGEDNAGAENESEEKPEDQHAHQQTAKDKIQEMIDRLNNQDFTRFWP